MSDRQIVVVDVETTGLDVARHIAVEVAWHNLNTGEIGCFVPPHNMRDALANGDLEALRINRYIDRLADAEQDRTGSAAVKLAGQLYGNTLAGSNPAFDAAFLAKMFGGYDTRDLVESDPGWHHRLLDLSSYAAPLLGIAPSELPGLHTVCERLGILNTAPHTAAGDVAATAACFSDLFMTAESRTESRTGNGHLLTDLMAKKALLASQEAS